MYLSSSLLQVDHTCLFSCFVVHKSALQIFQKESHPSVYKMGAGNSGAKEGLSLFGNGIDEMRL